MLLHASNLSLSIGNIPILRDVCVQVAQEEIVGLLGPNGAGKSTTIGVILGMYSRDSGTLELFDKRVEQTTPDIRRRIGVMPERAGFYEWMAAGEYLAWYGNLFGGAGKPISELLARVGLEDQIKRPIGQFSQGMRQRLALARAMVNNPELLILDEPTNGLDPRGRREIHDLFRALTEEHGVGILLCTHLLDDVDRLCHRIGIIHEGRTVLEGALAEVIAEDEANNLEDLYLRHTRSTGESKQGESA